MMEDADEHALYGTWSPMNPHKPGPLRWARRLYDRACHYWDWAPWSPYYRFRHARAWWLQRHQRRAAPALHTALRCLYEETADYIQINKLGDVHHNQSMKAARDALRAASGKALSQRP